MHIPRAIRDDVSIPALTLAQFAVDGELVVCAGAGLSKALPSDLPLGGELAERVYDDLEASLGHAAMNGAQRDDLLSVADTICQHDGGVEALQVALAAAADYTTAQP